MLRVNTVRYLAGLWPDAGAVEVLDVGANPIEGDAPYKGLMEAGLARVTGFEPQPGPLAELNARKSAAETYHPDALGAGGAARLHLFQHSGFTSLFPIRADTAQLVGFGRSTRAAGTLDIQTSRLDDLGHIGRVDFLKIDVQGAELDIIANGVTKLAEAVLIQTEVRFLPLYQDEPGFAALDAQLRSMGFQFHDFATLKRVALRSASHGRLRPRFNRQIVDGDALYIRDLTHVGALSDIQIFRLALLAESVIDSPNLVAFCLDTLVSRGRLKPDAVGGYLEILPAEMLRPN